MKKNLLQHDFMCKLIMNNKTLEFFKQSKTNFSGTFVYYDDAICSISKSIISLLESCIWYVCMSLIYVVLPITKFLIYVLYIAMYNICFIIIFGTFGLNSGYFSIM